MTLPLKLKLPLKLTTLVLRLPPLPLTLRQSSEPTLLCREQAGEWMMDGGRDCRADCDPGVPAMRFNITRHEGSSFGSIVVREGEGEIVLSTWPRPGTATLSNNRLSELELAVALASFGSSALPVMPVLPAVPLFRRGTRIAMPLSAEKYGDAGLVSLRKACRVFSSVQSLKKASRGIPSQTVAE
jgi:hypothetical protein